MALKTKFLLNSKSFSDRRGRHRYYSKHTSWWSVRPWIYSGAFLPMQYRLGDSIWILHFEISLWFLESLMWYEKFGELGHSWRKKTSLDNGFVADWFFKALYLHLRTLFNVWLLAKSYRFLTFLGFKSKISNEDSNTAWRSLTKNAPSFW